MATSKWKHRQASAGREFSVEKKDSRGISLRGGYVLDNGALLYARAGGVKSRFATSVITAGGNQFDIDQEVDSRVFLDGLKLSLGFSIRF